MRGVQRRKKNGQFAKKPGPKKGWKQASRLSPIGYNRGLLTPRLLPSVSPKRDTSGKLRDAKGRFLKATIEERHFDGRHDDRIRTRTRLTYDETIELYDFDTQNELPEWVSYLVGAP